MNIVPSNMTVAAHTQEMGRGEITVNKEYQRSDKVWPTVARAYLIESILLGYPIPKLSLYQVTDIKSRKTFKEIVDGQQRSMAILDFLNDKFSLARSLDTEDLAGKTYSELDDDLKHRFLDYSLGVDLFVGTTREQVREMFRRMNSYTVPLNAEEQRHAVFQGPFKWFINRLTKRFDQSFVEIGVYGEKQLVRMADSKLLSEICDALLHGYRTTNKKMLDALYRDRDKDFPEEKELEAHLTQAFDTLLEWTQLHKSALMRPHILYSLLPVPNPVHFLERRFGEINAHNSSVISRPRPVVHSGACRRDDQVRWPTRCALPRAAPGAAGVCACPSPCKHFNG